MFKKYVIGLSLLLTPISGAQAASWSVPTIPSWVSGVAEGLHEAVGEIDRRKQVACIGLGVYFESRGEPLRGQRAVASVIINRVYSPRFPDTPCDVLFQPKQFSFLNAGRILNPGGTSWFNAVEIGTEFVDKTKGEVPYLFFSSERGMRGHRIGHHIFA